VEHRRESPGNGPVNAVVNALKQVTGHTEVQMREFHIEALGSGSDAQASCMLSIELDGMISNGRAVHTDIVIAGAQAFVAALNHRAYQLELHRHSIPAAS
jgi:2-isopropylmalate synthase